MSNLFEDLPGVSVYVDDLVIYTQTWDEHVYLLNIVLQRLTDAKLTISLKKSKIGQAEVEYLGHRIGNGSIRPKDVNIRAITEFPEPQNKRELRRFLGMAGYYRKFCRDFATLSAPLTLLLKANVKYNFGPDQQHSFETIKCMLGNAPILKIPDFERPFRLYTDASGVGIGAVLVQEDDQGVEHPISYYSQKLTPTQSRYSTIELECLALLAAVKKFHIYLSNGHPVTCYTDQNPLTFLHRMKPFSSKLLRWFLILQEYPLQIQHLPGKANLVADALSRSPVEDNKKFTLLNRLIFF